MCVRGGVRRRGQMETLHPAQEVALLLLPLRNFSPHTNQLGKSPFFMAIPGPPAAPSVTQKLKALLC